MLAVGFGAAGFVFAEGTVVFRGCAVVPTVDFGVAVTTTVEVGSAKVPLIIAKTRARTTTVRVYDIDDSCL